MKEHIFKILLLVIGIAVSGGFMPPESGEVMEPLKSTVESCRLDAQHGSV